ncbi:MAG: M12 family metallopeptidase [Bryobacteraceae bacterium]|nr:M12 family metallopeptidase [Bryobacteraceae bacterium]
MTRRILLYPSVYAVVLTAQSVPWIELDSSVPTSTEARSIRLSGKLRGPNWTRISWGVGSSAGGMVHASNSRWETDPIPLAPGDNHIVITAWDAAGRSEQAGFFILRTSADPLPERTGTMDWFGRTVSYEVYNGTVIAEGCVELGPAQLILEEGSGRSGARAAFANPLASSRWPNQTIPYTIDSSVTSAMRTLIERAIAHWETRTPIRFTPRTSQANYLRIIRTDNPINTAGGIGMIGGEQTMRLREDAPFAIVVHEIGHTVGLLHEQGRQDSHRYVQVQMDEVRKDEFRQMYSFNSQMLGLYDLQSVMHYTKLGVTRLGNRTLETIPPGLEVYNPDGLSEADADSVARMYNQPRGRTILSTSPPNLTLIVDGQPVSTPAAFDWAVGTRHTIEAPASQGSGAVVHRFGRWNNDGERVQTITVSAAETVYTASYNRHCRITLRTPADPSLGWFTISPYAADGYYPCDGEVTLSAQPAEGVKFVDWTAFVGATNPRRFRVGQANLIRSNFTRGQTITFIAEPPGQTVRVNGASVPTPRTYPAADGSVFNVDAPTWTFGTVQFRFQKWSHGGPAAQTIRVTGSASSEYTVTYDTHFYASARAVPSDGGTVTLTPSSSDGFYLAGTNVEFRATAAANRQFQAWDGDLRGVAAPVASLPVDEPRYAEANFRDLASPTITSFSPEQVMAGSLPPVLFVNGTGFIEALTEVTVNGQRRAATILGPAVLSFRLTPEDLRAAGALTVRVSNRGRPDVASGTRALAITPPPAGCTYALGSRNVAAGPSFGAHSVSVSAPAGCPWYPATSDRWLAVAGSVSGAGDGTLTVWTEPNPSPEPRTGTVQVAGEVIEVTQQGAACDFAAVPARTLPAAGGAGTLFVRSYMEGCPWSIESGADWLGLEQTEGAGNANVAIAVTANPGPPREAVIRIGQTSIAVRQLGGAGAVILNEASGLPLLAPGARFVLNAQSLARAEQRAEGAWPAELGGIQVKFGDVAAPLSFVSPNRIVGQTPAGVSGEVEVRVIREDADVLTLTVTVVEAAPAVYPETFAVPAGGLLTVRLTGAGETNPAVPDGQPVPAEETVGVAGTVTALLNGREVGVESVRMVPGQVGVAEVAIRIPPDAGPIEQSLVVRVGGAESGPRVVQVQ